MSPERLNALLAPPPGVPDAALLRRYLDDRDEAAFELLVRRHAAAVWRVCRGVASDHHAAEDAFQVTFLALARKAVSVRTPVLVGWLCRVAHRAALKTRRRRVEALTVEPAVQPHDFDDTAAVLHAELDKLPDAERLPVLLCHLSGYTQAQAAAALGTATAGEPLVLRTLAVVQPDAAVPPALTALAHEVTSAMRPILLRTLALSGLAALAVMGAVFVPVVADDPKPAPKPAAPQPAKPTEAEVMAKLQLIHAKHYLTQVAEAYRQYVITHGKVPADVTDGNGKALLSWRVHLLTFIEQKNVHSLIKFDQAWDAPENEAMAKVLIKTFVSVVPGPPFVHNNHKYVGTRVRRIAGPTGANTDFATPPAKLDLEARQAVFGRLRETDYPVIIEVGIPTPWLKPDEDFEFDPKAKAVKLLGAHEAGPLVATAGEKVKLVSNQPDRETFADWMTKGAKATIDPAKLYPPVGKLSEADKAAADQIESMWLYHMEAQRKLEERRLKLRLELYGPKAPAGDPDPLRMTRQLDEVDRLVRDQTVESEVEQLEAELKKRAKK